MTVARPVLMMGWNQHWLTALDELLPASSVVVVEEPDVYEGKRIAARWSGHPVVREVLFAEYQQTDRFLDVVTRQHAREPVRCVLPALEYSVEAAAAAAHELGLPGAGTSAASVFRDKITQVTTCQRAGISVPRFTEVTDADGVAAFAGQEPFVLKPANRQASLGVVIVRPGDDPAQAWQECVRADEGPQLARRELRWRYLAEEFVAGPEYSVEALVTGGEIVFANVTAKRVHPGRYPVEAGHVVPAPVGPGVAELPALMQDLVGATGFGTGLLHGEWIVRDGTPVFVECAARPAGDWIFDLIDLVTGVNLYDAAVRALAGEDPLAGRRHSGLNPAAAVRFGFPAEPGTVTGVSGVEEASSAPGVVRVPHVPAAGDELRSLGSSWGRLAAVIATGADQADAESAAAVSLDKIAVTMRPYRQVAQS
jgi:biotin carboxylase